MRERGGGESYGRERGREKNTYRQTDSFDDMNPNAKSLCKATIRDHEYKIIQGPPRKLLKSLRGKDVAKIGKQLVCIK